MAIEKPKPECEVHSFHAKWILIFYKFYHLSLLTPYWIKFDKTFYRYKCFDGSWIRKVAFVVLHSIIILYSVWGFTITNLHQSSSSPTLRALYKFSYFMFGIYNGLWMIFMWKGMPKISDLLNKGMDLTYDLIRNNPDPFSEISYLRNMIKVSPFLRYPFLIFVLILTSISTLSYLIENIVTFESDANTFMLSMVNYTLSSFCYINNYWCIFDDHETGYPQWSAYVFTWFWLIISIVAESSWQTTFFVMIAWSLYFRRIMEIGLRKITISSSNHDMFHAIQDFAKITKLLEECNQIFGPMLLIHVINVLVYKCVTFGSYMTSQISVWLVITSSATNVLPYFLMIYFMADVHRVGCRVSTVLKHKYILSRQFDNPPISWNIYQASAILQNGALANNIAFKGCGFFTVSFSFIGSLIGILTTYTLVTVELTSA